MQLSVGARVVPVQLLVVRSKSLGFAPLKLVPEIDSEPEPVLVNMMVLAGMMPPRPTLPKSMLVWLSVTSGWTGTRLARRLEGATTGMSPAVPHCWLCWLPSEL